MWYYLSANPKDETGLRFQGLFGMTRDARKLTRLGKTINEISTLQTYFRPEASKGTVCVAYFLCALVIPDGGFQRYDVCSIDPFGQAVQIIGRVGWGTYWYDCHLLFVSDSVLLIQSYLMVGVAHVRYRLWDNLVYLNKAKFYSNPNKIDLNYNGALGWTVGLLANVVLNARELSKSFDNEAALVVKRRSLNSKLSGDVAKDKVTAIVFALEASSVLKSPRAVPHPRCIGVVRRDLQDLQGAGFLAGQACQDHQHPGWQLRRSYRRRQRYPAVGEDPGLQAQRWCAGLPRLILGHHRCLLPLARGQPLEAAVPWTRSLRCPLASFSCSLQRRLKHTRFTQRCIAFQFHVARKRCISSLCSSPCRWVDRCCLPATVGKPSAAGASAPQSSRRCNTPVR